MNSSSNLPKGIHLLLLTLIMGSGLMAQTSFRKQTYEAKFIRSFEPTSVKTSFAPRLQSLEAPKPGGEGYHDFLARVKEQVTADFPIQERNTAVRGTQSADSPQILDGFGLTWEHPTNGTTYHAGGRPNDNTLALSEDGYLLTSWNTLIYAHDMNADTAMYKPNPFFNAISFAQFADTLSTSAPFDPKILYDPIEKRFILMYLSGRTPQDSKTILGFSTSTNPTDPWNLYEIDGNPLDTNFWSDYPQIAITKDELFYTVNLLEDGQSWIHGFRSTLIWQIDKKSGYRGDATLTLDLWDEINYNGKPLRYFRPIKNGSGPAGPNMYFISNRSIPVDFGDTLSYSNDSIFLIEVTDTKASGNATLVVRPGKANARYHTPPAARQATGAQPLFTNDARVLGGFLHNGEIQFVGNTLDSTSGRCGIYHGIIKNLNGPIDVSLEIIGDDSLDLGFPNITYSGINASNQSALIGFDHSSPNHFAGNAVVYYDGKGNYSEVKRVIDGEGYVDVINGTSERWGTTSECNVILIVPSQLGWQAILLKPITKVQSGYRM
ncbi:hypothetical protein KFE98_00245 [bacterium SCSIO 12741]|nr:hypothetical protein KFE98_00245 [bacterium SCSIO 12741]